MMESGRDVEALIAEARKAIRTRVQAASFEVPEFEISDILVGRLTDALERQQDVVKAAREAYQFGFHVMSSQETHPEQRATGFTVAYRGDDDDKMGDLWEVLGDKLAALDAPPPEGEKAAFRSRELSDEERHELICHGSRMVRCGTDLKEKKDTPPEGAGTEGEGE